MYAKSRETREAIPFSINEFTLSHRIPVQKFVTFSPLNSGKSERFNRSACDTSDHLLYYSVLFVTLNLNAYITLIMHACRHIVHLQAYFPIGKRNPWSTVVVTIRRQSPLERLMQSNSAVTMLLSWFSKILFSHLWSGNRMNACESEFGKSILLVFETSNIFVFRFLFSLMK